MKPSVGQSSNCIFPEYVAAAIIQTYGSTGGEGNLGVTSCGMAYSAHIDPVTTNYYGQPASGPIPAGYPGYDPLSVDPNAPAKLCFWKSTANDTAFVQSGFCDVPSAMTVGAVCRCSSNSVGRPNGKWLGTVMLAPAGDGTAPVVR